MLKDSAHPVLCLEVFPGGVRELCADNQTGLSALYREITLTPVLLCGKNMDFIKHDCVTSIFLTTEEI